MSTLTARPQLLKQANLALIRKVIKGRGTATRAEIAGETQISSTTVRSLLAEMLESGEIQSMGYDESSGGRKAERYRFQPERYHGAVFCLAENQVHFLLVNICGEIVERAQLELLDGAEQETILSYLDMLVTQREIKAIGLGVPGIVEGGGFWRKEQAGGELCRVDLGDILLRRYGIPVVMENDLNAATIGLGRCYEKSFSGERTENTNMAYLHFEENCVSAGFLADGRIIRGHNNFAGELSLVPVGNDRLLDEYLTSSISDEEYTNLVIKLVSWVCAILNPQYVALGGPKLRKSCMGPIGDGLFALLPQNMLAEILYVPDMCHDYHEGMAYLTAGKMFDEVQFIKE